TEFPVKESAPIMNINRYVQFLTWTAHRRTRTICNELGIELIEKTTRRSGVSRYVELTWRTVIHLFATRPGALIVQTPSMVLGLLALTLRPLLRYQLIFDAHNEAVQPYLHASSYMRLLAKFL